MVGIESSFIKYVFRSYFEEDKPNPEAFPYIRFVVSYYEYHIL